MNLVNQKVMHLKQDFGLGIIVEQDENIVTVKFEHKEHKMKMQYPEAFLNYVKLIDTNLQNQIEVLAKEKIVSENERTALSLKRQREKIVHDNAFKPTHGVLNTSYRPCIAFKLNYCDGGKSEHIVGLSSYMYYNIGKITSSEVTSLISCSDYVHAFRTSTLARATDYTLDFFGIVRGASMDDYYTYQNCAQASWEGSW